MLKKFDTTEDMTSQRLTALLCQMEEDGLVEKTKDKGKSLFSLAQ
jgi:DNA-binding HxlR family transcriptional regulator